MTVNQNDMPTQAEIEAAATLVRRCANAISSPIAEPQTCEGNVMLYRLVVEQAWRIFEARVYREGFSRYTLTSPPMPGTRTETA